MTTVIPEHDWMRPRGRFVRLQAQASKKGLLYLSQGGRILRQSDREESTATQ